MRRSTGLLLYAACVVGAVLVVEVPDWHAPVPGTQLGPNASSMVQFALPSAWKVGAPPAQAEPAAATGGPAATAAYTNVTVLTDVSQAEFDRLHRAMTAWVSPQQGCAFCHTGAGVDGKAGGNFAADDNPMKAITRDHLRLTRYLNTTWKAHMGENGVTCFSCHRGEPVPPETWFPSTAKPPHGLMARSENWNESADTVRKFFPDNGYALYFLHDEPIHGQATTVLREGTAASQVSTKRIYEMMMQMSDGIGVNCGFCHNSRAFWDWSQSTPARWVAYDAIRMIRDVNLNFLLAPLKTLTQTRDLSLQNSLVVPLDHWPKTGNGLAVCATCHYGQIKPDPGAATLANYGVLGSAVNAAPTQTNAAVPGPPPSSD